MSQRLKDFILYVGFPSAAGIVGALIAGRYGLPVSGGIAATALWAYAQRVWGTSYQEALVAKLDKKVSKK
jgi:hypothetical protein